MSIPTVENDNDRLDVRGHLKRKIENINSIDRICQYGYFECRWDNYPAGCVLCIGYEENFNISFLIDVELENEKKKTITEPSIQFGIQRQSN